MVIKLRFCILETILLTSENVVNVSKMSVRKIVRTVTEDQRLLGIIISEHFCTFQPNLY